MTGNEFESMGRDCSEGGHEGPPRNNREECFTLPAFAAYLCGPRQLCGKRIAKKHGNRRDRKDRRVRGDEIKTRPIGILLAVVWWDDQFLADLNLVRIA